MNVALWIATGVLIAVFLLAGVNKVVIPREKLAAAPGGGWVMDFSPGFLKALGAVEILGAAGLTLLHVVPILVPLAATGLAVIMVGAAIVVYRRREFLHLLVDLTYLALAVFVAIGRF